MLKLLQKENEIIKIVLFLLFFLSKVLGVFVVDGHSQLQWAPRQSAGRISKQ